MPAERLGKVLAAAGVASRRAADALVEAGRVTVDGRTARLGEKADPALQVVAVDGRRIGASAAQPVYVALHKPAGVTSTAADRHAARTVLDLVPERLVSRSTRIYPVGRLDLESEGLILLTNDGAWTERVLHPRHGVEREYAVAVALPLDAGQRAALAAGIPMEEGTARLVSLRPATRTETALLAAQIDPPPGAGTVWYRVVLAHGWKRQVRRMFGAVGAPVLRLVRVRVGTLRLDLPAGEARLLAPAEARRLAASAPLERPRRPARLVGLGDMRERGPIVALDGPGSSGKSSVGAAVAAALGARFLDTGLLYRALTWLCLERGLRPDDGPAVARLAAEIDLEPDAAGRLTRVIVGGLDVADRIRTGRVDRAVSAVSRQPEVRAALLDRQRSIAAAGAIVVAGRDIGSVVLPDADVKIWLDASAEERAARRARERGIDPASPAGVAILDDLRRRDQADGSRAVSPSRAADDAVHVRTDGNAFEETVSAVLAVVRAAGGAPKGRP
jgi:cytidylate kinase